MDPITLAVGAGILGVGMLTGHITGRRAAARQRPEPPPEPICGCGHHLANHDRETGTCHTEWLENRWDQKPGHGQRKWQERVECVCRQYVGPEPITSFWTPPVLDATPGE